MTCFDETMVKRFTASAETPTIIIWSAETVAGQWKLRAVPSKYGPRPWQNRTDIAMQATVPMNRLGSPDECAGTFLYLASDEASYVVGETIAIDGGLGL